MDNHGYVEFLPGFTGYHPGTIPGTILENDDYILTFKGVLLNGRNSDDVSQLSVFDYCYDWTPVMNIALDSVRDLITIERSEEMAVNDLASWLMTYPGWGLLSRLLPRQKYVNLKNRLMEIKEHIGESYSEEDCWNILFTDAGAVHLLRDMRDTDISVDISEGNFGGEARRKKWFDIHFSTSKWTFTVSFHIQKRKIWSSSLVDIASASVARSLEVGGVNLVNELDIPTTLRLPLIEMVRDQAWMADNNDVSRSFVSL